MNILNKLTPCITGDLVDFSKLAPPDPELVERNSQRVEALKQKMGKKWLLATPIKRKS